MYRRRSKVKKSNYQIEYTGHINSSAKFNGLDIKTNFIVVGKDMPNEYPKPDSIVAVLGNHTSERFWYVKPTSNNNYMYQDEMDDMGGDIDYTRSFKSQPATFTDGITDTRYLMVVDHINSDGEIVCFDDQNEPHIFSDSDLMVVDLYLYPSNSFDSTFKDGYDYAETALAVRIFDVIESERVLQFICDSPCMYYERAFFIPTQDDKVLITDIYKERGLVLGKDQPMIRVRFENCIIDGLALNEDANTTDTIPYAVEVIGLLHDMGYHIDIVSKTYKKNGGDDFKTYVNFLDSRGIKYNSVNGMFNYDMIVDTRNVMSWGYIDWGKVYKVITNEDLDLVAIEDAKEAENQVINGDIVSDDYAGLLTISQPAYQALIDEQQLTKIYPLAPLEWDVVGNLQQHFNGGVMYDDLDDGYKQLVDVLGLKDFFS